jgi:hypothetical protein
MFFKKTVYNNILYNFGLLCNHMVVGLGLGWQNIKLFTNYLITVHVQVKMPSYSAGIYRRLTKILILRFVIIIFKIIYF